MPELNWATRCGLGTLALSGTMAFAWSYTLPGAPAGISTAMRCVSWAAGLSWLCLGMVLINHRPSAWRTWMDLCLRVMGVGMIFLLICTAMNFAEVSLNAWVHGSLLAAGGLVMTLLFLTLGNRAGLRWQRALLFWCLGLQCSFLVFLAILWQGTIR